MSIDEYGGRAGAWCRTEVERERERCIADLCVHCGSGNAPLRGKGGIHFHMWLGSGVGDVRCPAEAIHERVRREESDDA
jgi:hypothetical protein